MAPERKKRKMPKVKLSKIYTFFRRGRQSSAELEREASQIGGPGFSRVAFVNVDPAGVPAGPGAAPPPAYPSNTISTTKYNAITFIPKSLFEQFRRVANFYFLVTGCLAYTALAPFGGSSAVLPLVFVISLTMLKEAIEDRRRRQQDKEVNNRKVLVRRAVDGDAAGEFVSEEWMKVRVGDIVRVEKDQFFPADLVLLGSSFDDGICYVETMNLDGETNLKIKQALEVTSSLQDDASFDGFSAVVRCEDPNAHLYTFVGNIELPDDGEQGLPRPHPLSPQQLLLRDSKLRNTDFVYGAVVFTGHDTKVMQNSTPPPSKRSKVEKRMDKLIYLLMAFLILISSIGSVVFGVDTADDLRAGGRMIRWYLRPDDANIFFDPKNAAVSAMLHFLTAMMLYGYFIPISLYVSIEIVKFLQALFINSDRSMYHEESDTPARARTSNLNEELGQVDTILSDKTGTLTCNSMEFVKCSIAGVAYGRGITEVEKAMAKRKGVQLISEIEDASEEEPSTERKPKVKGFNFTDDRIAGGNWVHQDRSDIIERFLRLLAVCHTCIPEADESTGKTSYEAESPDEAAFVVAARELGFEFFQRTQTTVSLREHPVASSSSGAPVERTYKLLHVLEFSSARKRMSVVVKDGEGRILLLSKGADSVMFERLSREKPAGYEEITKEHINEYADAGLRTLVLAYRELDGIEYDAFDKKFLAAKSSIGPDRDEKIEAAADSIERELILLGATAVEDKLQRGVPECIDKLSQAGIKIWVLTGDKMETAINIGFACSLLRQGMTQVVVTTDTPAIAALEKAGDKRGATRESRRHVLERITEGKKLVNAAAADAVFALVIDGKSLTYALEADAEATFFDLAKCCGSVICCRSSPMQKALVTRLVKKYTGKVTLGIGDGANDVGMLQEADIGIGISGAEGMQAVMASDVSIAQFRFLERLLLVHGHWCYRRITAMICYFFFKNILFGVTLFIYEGHTTFSGQAMYNEWAMSLYNVFFTAMPVIALGVLDQDVSPRFCLRFPVLYQEGAQNLLFRWRIIFAWMAYGFADAIAVFYLTDAAMHVQAFTSGGFVVDLASVSLTAYTSIVWIANCQMVLSSNYFTVIQHVLIWGSIAVWYIFLMAYGAFDPSQSTTAYMVFLEALAPAGTYWLTTLFVSVAVLLPFIAYSTVQQWIFPNYHNRIQWVRRLELRQTTTTDDVEQVIRQLSTRPATVGVSARRDARNVHIKRKVRHHDDERQR